MSTYKNREVDSSWRDVCNGETYSGVSDYTATIYIFRFSVWALTYKLDIVKRIQVYLGHDNNINNQRKERNEWALIDHRRPRRYPCYLLRQWDPFEHFLVLLKAWWKSHSWELDGARAGAVNRTRAAAIVIRVRYTLDAPQITPLWNITRPNEENGGNRKQNGSRLYSTTTVKTKQHIGCFLSLLNKVKRKENIKI